MDAKSKRYEERISGIKGWSEEYGRVIKEIEDDVDDIIDSGEDVVHVAMGCCDRLRRLINWMRTFI
tara:strand:- start:46 stop:243 length:198 start_codon:yes stop_codon:yes gene_type:complete